ncbi:MAG TPA: hypothetical protein VLF90_02760 [Patescibacteria group bacterium]|nr:hypothetical protein [Patescibacteria group bacterium]
MSETAAWLQSPNKAVWLDLDLLTGSGLIEEIAPDYFMHWDDGLERVRFGKLIGLSGGPEQVVPIVPEQLPKIVEAADEDPSEAVMIEEVGVRSSQELWIDFFSSALNDARKIITQPIMTDELFKTQLEYVASIIDPQPAARFKRLRPSKYDELDTIVLVGNSLGSDKSGRIQTAEDIREHFIARKPLSHQEMQTLQDIRTRAFTYLGQN